MRRGMCETLIISYSTEQVSPYSMRASKYSEKSGGLKGSPFFVRNISMSLKKILGIFFPSIM